MWSAECVKDSHWQTDQSDRSGIEVWRLKQGLLSGDSGRYNRNLSVWLPLNLPRPHVPRLPKAVSLPHSLLVKHLRHWFPHPARLWGQFSATTTMDDESERRHAKRITSEKRSETCSKAQMITSVKTVLFWGQPLLRAAADNVADVQ